MLPRLRGQCTSRAVPLQDLLTEKGFHEILDFIGDLDCVADLKVSKDKSQIIGLLRTHFAIITGSPVDVEWSIYYKIFAQI